ncbi:MAG TPA: pyridoxal 5'-phosphate synthase glutaminase subunit PdxT [Actinobacteria bacterium]|nr:pyridoxal 5'-phosphate synthase glutaminase subunit PdxT [Actinomycetota bacterium]
MSAAPHIGVLALQGDIREHLASLEAAGATARPVTSLADLAAVQGLVIPGGESTTMSKLALHDGLMAPLQQARIAGMPMFGSCAGMIMLADRVTDAREDQQFISGIDMTVCRNAFGRQVDSFEVDLEVRGLSGGPLRGVFIRAPWVERAGEQVEILATLQTGEQAGTIVAVKQGPLLATSFHPELTGDHRIHATFVELVRHYA